MNWFLKILFLLGVAIFTSFSRTARNRVYTRENGNWWHNDAPTENIKIRDELMYFKNFTMAQSS